MKKISAMLLSLLMCFSLLAIPAQAALIPAPEDPGTIDVGGNPVNPPGDDGEDPDEPGNSPQHKLPEDRDHIPTD